jgi:4-hydroxy-tetrahydrodipicolinate reductase
MKLALIGYGKMGRMLEALAPEYGLSVGLILDEHNNANFEGLTKENFDGIDVAIEFSIPSATVRNVEALTALGVPVVIGTTGWLEEMDRVRTASERHGSPVVWSPNYSVGVNVFFRLVHEAAKLLSAQADYGAYAWEIHHDEKKDAPSGTLLKLVDEMKTAGYARPRIRLRCGIRRGAERALRAGLCKRPSGLWANRDSTSFRRFCLEGVSSHVYWMRDSAGYSVSDGLEPG